jgi:ketosteroid isomerase-like protein
VSNLEQVIAVLVPLFTDDQASVDDAMIDRFAEAVAERAEPGFETSMISQAGAVQHYEGAEGMRAGLKDWSETFSSLRFEAQDVQVFGDNVLTLAQQIGVTRHGGVEIEQPSAVVWKFRDGRIHRVEWHLDRAAAERSARYEQRD